MRRRAVIVRCGWGAAVVVCGILVLSLADAPDDAPLSPAPLPPPGALVAPRLPAYPGSLVGSPDSHPLRRLDAAARVSGARPSQLRRSACAAEFDRTSRPREWNDSHLATRTDCSRCPVSACPDHSGCSSEDSGSGDRDPRRADRTRVARDSRGVLGGRRSDRAGCSRADHGDDADRADAGHAGFVPALDCGLASAVADSATGTGIAAPVLPAAGASPPASRSARDAGDSAARADTPRPLPPSLAMPARAVIRVSRDLRDRRASSAADSDGLQAMPEPAPSRAP